MGRYTDSLKDLSFDLYPDDDDFEQKLAEVAGQFRPFDVALTAFLIENGLIRMQALCGARWRIQRMKTRLSLHSSLPV